MKETVRMLPGGSGQLMSCFELGFGEQNVMRNAGKWIRRQQQQRTKAVTPLAERLAAERVTTVTWSGELNDIIDLNDLAAIVGVYAFYRRQRLVARLPFIRRLADEDADIAERLAGQLQSKADELVAYLPLPDVGDNEW